MTLIPEDVQHRRVRFSDGQVVVTEGDATTEAFVICTGNLVAYRAGRCVGEFGPGAVLGEKAAVNGTPRAATLVARGAVDLALVDRASFVRWCATDPRLRAQLDLQRVRYAVGDAELSACGTSAVAPGDEGNRWVRPASVEHAPDGTLRAWIDGADAADDTIVARVADSTRTLRLLRGVIVEVSVFGEWPRVGTAVSHMVEGTVLDEAARERFARRGEVVAPVRTEELVCVCRGAGAADVRRCVLAGARDVDAVAGHLGIHTACGRCLPRVAEVVEQTTGLPGIEAPEPSRSCPYRPLPSVRQGWRRVPLVGDAALLKDVVTDPIGLVERGKAALGESIVIPIPTRFELVYLGQDAFDRVLDLPAAVGQMGPVMGNVPSIGFWFARARNDSESLQALLLMGRSIIAHAVDRALADDRFARLADEAIDRHLGTEGEVECALDPVSRVFADVAAAAVVGESLWDELRDPCLRLLRDIHDGTDVVRATLSVTPAHRWMREYVATRAIAAPLQAAIARHPGGTGPLDALLYDDAHPLEPADRAWMLLYVLWNATIYPGSYGAWTFADVITHPEFLQAGLNGDRVAREQAWARAFLETTRMWPVGSLVRALAADVEIESGGCTYALKAGQVLGVFPWERNRQPERYADPLTWRPDRWQHHLPRSGLFGRGAYGCVAVTFNERLFGAVIDGLVTRYSFEPLAALPARRCRVHLTYPDSPWPMRVSRYAKGVTGS